MHPEEEKRYGKKQGEGRPPSRNENPTRKQKGSSRRGGGHKQDLEGNGEGKKGQGRGAGRVTRTLGRLGVEKRPYYDESTKKKLREPVRKNNTKTRIDRNLGSLQKEKKKKKRPPRDRPRGQGSTETGKAVIKKLAHHRRQAECLVLGLEGGKLKPTKNRGFKDKIKKKKKNADRESCSSSYMAPEGLRGKEGQTTRGGFPWGHKRYLKSRWERKKKSNPEHLRSKVKKELRQQKRGGTQSTPGLKKQLSVRGKKKTRGVSHAGRPRE